MSVQLKICGGVRTRAGMPQRLCGISSTDFRIKMNNVLIEEALRRAIAAEQSGDLDRAQKDLERSLEIDPNHPMARNNLAVLLARRGNPAAALQILSELIASNPGYPSAYFNRANVFLALGRTENAIADFINVTELDLQ